eukprot:PhF_6_TR37842/c0_g1_i1/m.56336/K03108/SRP72; signal recognition particle subunit SRP72
MSDADAKKKIDEIRKLQQTLQLCQSDLRSVQQICDKILVLSPKDATIIRYKACALIDAQHYDTAAKWILSNPENPWTFGVAYCYYRQERYDDALEVLKGSTSYEERNLRAQCLYRRDKFLDSSREYEELLKMAKGLNRDSDEVDEIVVNWTAALLEAGLPADAQKVIQAHGKTTPHVDFILNNALTGLQCGEIPQSISLLEKHVNKEDVLGSTLLAEEMLPGEDAAFCAVFSWLYRALGRNDLAAQFTDAVIQHKTKSVATTAVCMNNWVVLHDASDVFDSLHKMKHVLSRPVESKLSAAQRMVTRYNNVVLAIRMGKPQQAISQSTQLFKENPTSDLALMALGFATACAGNKSKAIDLLEKNATGALATTKTILLLAQLILEQSGLEGSLEALKKLHPDNLFVPNIAAAVCEIALQRGGRDLALATAFLTKAVDHWKKKQQDHEYVLASLRILSNTYLRSNNYAEAVKILKQLLEIERDDATMAQYIKALSFVDVEEALNLCEKFPSAYNQRHVQELMDSGKLETEELPRPAKVTATEKRPADGAEREKSEAKKAKKRKPNRHPVKVPEGAPPPDPERWLPIRERPSMKKLGKKTLAKLAVERKELGKKQRAEYLLRKAGGPVPTPASE